jgi:hypothetical protein
MGYLRREDGTAMRARLIGSTATCIRWSPTASGTDADEEVLKQMVEAAKILWDDCERLYGLNGGR